MAKGKGLGKAEAKVAKDTSKTVQRKRRNSFQRKCLPKAYKRLFARDTPAQFRSMLAAWDDGRKKVSSKDD